MIVWAPSSGPRFDRADTATLEAVADALGDALRRVQRTLGPSTPYNVVVDTGPGRPGQGSGPHDDLGHAALDIRLDEVLLHLRLMLQIDEHRVQAVLRDVAVRAEHGHTRRARRNAAGEGRVGHNGWNKVIATPHRAIAQSGSIATICSNLSRACGYVI